MLGKYRGIYRSTYIPLFIKLLHSIKDLTFEEEVDDRIESLLTQNAKNTRMAIRRDFKRRYLTFDEGLLVKTPLLEFVSHTNDLALIRELLYYHYIRAERIGAEVVMDVLYPRLPNAEYEMEEVMSYLAKKMPEMVERTWHNVYSFLKTALKDFGLLKRVDDRWVAQPYSPKLESFVYALHHEFTVDQNYLNPRVAYLLEEAELPRLFLMSHASVRDYIQRARRAGLISYEVCAGDEQVALIHKSLDRVTTEMIRGIGRG
ncbi:MAG: DUF1819 family protein [Candidatus Bathyarchaeum sp.]|nr:MAG: DUF1819 family protein [Candidatus Bathyarchaeum sp.]